MMDWKLLLRGFDGPQVHMLPPVNRVDIWNRLAVAKAKLCHHRGWFNVPRMEAVQCPQCLMVVTDHEVIRFAKSQKLSPNDVYPGTVLAKKLHAPWAGL